VDEIAKSAILVLQEQDEAEEAADAREMASIAGAHVDDRGAGDIVDAGDALTGGVGPAVLRGVAVDVDDGAGLTGDGHLFAEVVQMRQIHQAARR